MAIERAMVVVVGVVLLGGMVTASLTARRGSEIERVRARLERFVAAQKEREAARSKQRPVLWGDTLSGDAGACYEAADNMLATCSSREVEKYLCPGNPDSAWARELCWSELAPAFAQLRLGAHSATVDKTGARRTDAGRLVAVCESAFAHAVKAGEWDEAVSSWLDGAAFVLDSYPDRRLVCIGDWSSEQLRALDAKAAARLAEGLERIEQFLPLQIDVASVLSTPTQCLLSHGGPGDVTWREQFAAWRFGFDTNRRELIVADRLLASLSRLEPVCRCWSDRVQQWCEFLGGDEAEMPSQIWNWLRYQRTEECQQRKQLTRVRLLRLALAIARGETPPQLDDPFGSGPLQFAIGDDGQTATLRSVGAEAPIVRYVDRSR